MNLFPFLNNNQLNKNKSNTKASEEVTLIDSDLNRNINTIKELFHFPDNKDILIRDIYIKSLNKKSKLVYLTGMVFKDSIEKNVIRPLMKDSIDVESDNELEDIMNRVLHISEVKKVNDFNMISNEIITGNSILFIDGFNLAISINTLDYNHRSVERAQNETVIKGPQEAFTESGEVNRSLIRKQLKSKDLVTEFIPVGQTDLTIVSIMYLKNIVNPELLNEIRTRIKNIDIDGIDDTSVLEQCLEERPYSPIPTLLYTERPDRACAFIKEGHIAILTDNSPSSLIAPVTFWSFFHTGAEQYQRWLYGNFIRFIRVLAYLVALFTPSLYLAVTNFHPGSIPLDLLLAIASTREIVPFPAYVEVLIMEISFELVREAGIRIPTPIGPTIGIVGALILGQAAVEANIVSPILVIIVAITGIGSFAIPDISMSYTVRITRFLFLAISAAFGLMGLTMTFTAIIIYLSSITSFGVSFYSPVSPHYPSSRDTLFRPIIVKRILRPFYLFPLNKKRGINTKRR